MHACDWVASVQADITCRMEIGCRLKNSMTVPQSTPPVLLVCSGAKLASRLPTSSIRDSRILEVWIRRYELQNCAKIVVLLSKCSTNAMARVSGS